MSELASVQHRIELNMADEIRQELGGAVVTIEYSDASVKIAAEWHGLHTGVELTADQVTNFWQPDYRPHHWARFAVDVIVAALRRAYRQQQEAVAA